MSEAKCNITIKVDTNDADYIEVTREISIADLETIHPLIQAIKSFKPYEVKVNGLKWTHRHNFPFQCARDDLGEKDHRELYNHIDEEVFEIFEDFLPWFEDYGFHSIVSIEVHQIVPKTQLL